MESHEPGPADEKPVVLESDAPVPLAYQAPRDRPESERPDGLARILAGLVTGSCVVGFASLLLFTRINFVVIPETAPRVKADHWIAVAYFLCAAGSGAIIAKGAKTPGWRAAGRWFALGTLLGAGTAMLVEGICFAAQ